MGQRGAQSTKVGRAHLVLCMLVLCGPQVKSAHVICWAHTGVVLYKKVLKIKVNKKLEK